MHAVKVIPASTVACLFIGFFIAIIMLVCRNMSLPSIRVREKAIVLSQRQATF